MSTSSFLQRNLAHPIILVIFVIVLVPTFFFPLWIDQSTFVRGGEVLFGGGKLYADYFDQKPPLLFFFYGISGILFGKSDIGYRCFDFLWQLCTVLSLLYCVQRLTKNKVTGIASAGVYALLYSSMQYSETLECESFIALALVWLIYLTVSTNSTKESVVLFRGALAGFIFAMKFTFGVAFIIILLWEIMNGLRGRTRIFILLTVGFCISTLGSLSLFFDAEVLHGYFRVLEYTRIYAGNPPINLELIRNALAYMGQFFGGNISLTIILATAFGVGISLKNHSTNQNNSTVRLAQISILLFLAFLTTIIIERKFNPYHYLRLFIPLSVLSSLGIPFVLSFFQKKWQYMTVSWKILVISSACFVLAMSPMKHWIMNAHAGYLYFAARDSYWATFQKPDDPVWTMVDARNIAGYISSSPKKGRTFAVTIVASYIYRILDEYPISKFSMPMYYYSTFSPKGAYKEMTEEVELSHWLVIQQNDVYPSLYGHSKSSWECVQQDSIMFDYLTTNFTKVKEIGAFYIFERNE